MTNAEGQTMIKTIDAEYYNKCSAAARTGMKNVFESAVVASINYKKKKSSILKRGFGRWTWMYPCPGIRITFKVCITIFSNVVAQLVISWSQEIWKVVYYRSTLFRYSKNGHSIVWKVSDCFWTWVRTSLISSGMWQWICKTKHFNV